MNKVSLSLLSSLLCLVPMVQIGRCDKVQLRSGTQQAGDEQVVDPPNLAETQASAEEAYIYSLPIVMNYAVMHEFCIDKNSGQYKYPFNTISNETRVFTYKDTAVVTPNSDTPYSMLWFDLQSEPTVLSVPAVPKDRYCKDRYYSVQLIDGNAYNYGYIGSRASGYEMGDCLSKASI